MFMSNDELVTLTGYQRPKGMIKKLKEYGVRFFIAKDGYPRVARSEIERPQQQTKSQPNIGFLKTPR